MKMNEESYQTWSLREKSVADLLFEIEAVQLGTFRLKLHEKSPDAPLSPIYINLRLLRSHPEVIDGVLEVYEEMSQGLQFDCYADVPTAATPIVAILSYLTGIPMITPRKPKTHGVPGTIDGVFQEGQTALLIDDLVTKGSSIIEAIHTLEANELKVKDVLVLVNREQGGTEQLQRLGYNLHAAFKLSTLLLWYLDTDKIDQAKYEETMAYLTANK